MDSRDLNICLEYAEDPDPPASLEFLEVCKSYMETSVEYRDLSLPNTVCRALDLYIDLISYIDQF